MLKYVHIGKKFTAVAPRRGPRSYQGREIMEEVNAQADVFAKKTLYSAVQPTNALTIGNYIGAIKNMVAMQEEYNCFFAIANMHAITVRQVPAELRKNTLS